MLSCSKNVNERINNIHIYPLFPAYRTEYYLQGARARHGWDVVAIQMGHGLVSPQQGTHLMVDGRVSHPIPQRFQAATNYDDSNNINTCTHLYTR